MESAIKEIREMREADERERAYRDELSAIAKKLAGILSAEELRSWWLVESLMVKELLQSEDPMVRQRREYGGDAEDLRCRLMEWMGPRKGG